MTRNEVAYLYSVKGMESGVSSAAGGDDLSSVKGEVAMVERPTVFEVDGPRGGQYFAVDLSDGRRLLVSRKTNDQRVWLGRTNDPESYAQQRGGIGTIDKLLDEWRARIALDSDVQDVHWALSALAASRRA